VQLRRVVAPVVRRVYRLDVRGLERLPASGPLLVAANHASLVDPFVLGAAIPRSLRFLAKAELWRLPLLDRVLDSLGGIPVDRGRGDLTAMRRAREALDAGEAVAVFPEGTVRRGGPWLRGAARLALGTGATLVPVRLVGTADALRAGHVGLPRVAVLIGAPIEVATARPTIAAARELTTRLEEAVASLGR
jgi:1-acyl-sn-glycerol-3-phosphate acyltransferase